MHPPDVDLLVILHAAQSESGQATTFSVSSGYLFQFTALGISCEMSHQPDEFVPVFSGSDDILLVDSFVANAMSTLSCAKKVALLAILLCFVAPDTFNASPLLSSSGVHSHLVSSHPLFLRICRGWRRYGLEILCACFD